MEAKDRLDKLTEKIIGHAIEVHREMGPGLLESTYEACLFYELSQTNLKIERQKALSFKYKNINIDCSYRLDFMVNDEVIVEIKSVAKLLPIHTAQLLTYLKLSGCTVGLLMNFNETLMKKGIIRLVNEFPD